MTNDETRTSENMTMEEVIDTLKWLVFGTFDRTTAKEREALDVAIKVLEKQPKWILCKDELPAQNTDVIITVVDKPLRYTYVGWQMGKTWISNNDLVCGDVIAWMPLPISYQGEENGKENEE